MAERRLAAIMFTDIVGYTALMAESEETGLRVRARHREVVRPLVERYHGESIEARGDESLSTFPTALDAVSCALAIEEQLRDDAELKLHLGIHLGDLILQDGEVSGDGVNIASRICALSEGGGLCVSGEVHRSIRNQPGIETTALGEQTLKNVPEPVAVYAVTGTAAAPHPVAKPAQASRGRTVPLASWALAALVVIAIASAWWLYRAETDLAPIRSIAVLPLDNLSGDPEQEYFADGMTEALIGDLAKISSLRVTSRTSVMQYKGVHKPLPEIARELDVDAVLEGTVARAGDRIRITAQLIRAETDEHLWAESYERKLEDVLALQGEVARSVAAELRIELTAQERSRLQVTERIDPQAQELYLRGRVLMNSDYYGLRESVPFFEAAIEKDPTFANAHASLAEAYVLLADFELRPSDAFPRVIEAATRAIELDPGNADARAALGAAALGRWDWERADHELGRAIELNRNSAMAHRYRSWYLMAIGRAEECVVEIERAASLVPLYVAHHIDLVVLTDTTRDDERIRRQALEFLEMGWPNETTWWPRVLLALVHVRSSRPNEATEELERALAAAGDLAQGQAVVAAGLATAGQAEQARRILGRLEERSQTEWVSGYFLALAYAQLGEIELAFESLDRAVVDRDGWLPYLNVQRAADPLRSDPRFQDVLGRIHYPGTS